MKPRLRQNKKDFHCCQDCGKSYDYHEIGADGKPFLCRCPHREWSQFLDIPQFCLTFKNK